MKYPTINNYLETICNPKDRFRTLKDVEAVKSDKGELELSIGNTRADFSIRADGKNYVMSCQLSGESFADVRFYEICKHINHKNIPYLQNMEVLSEEMYVFDSCDRGAYYDVLLTEAAPGLPLGKLLLKLSGVKDTNRLKSIFDSFVEFACYMLSNRPFVHNNIKLSNIFVGNFDEIFLMDYKRLLIPENPGFAKSARNDNVSFVIIALLLYSSIFNRKIIRDLHGFSMKETANYLVSKLDGSQEPGIKELVDILKTSSAADDHKVMAALESLSKFQSKVDPGKFENKKPEPDYIIESQSFEGLSCAQKNDKYGYVGKNGDIIVPFIYDWAGDFQEGLAVVRIGSDYGVIDKEGRMVLPLIYEDISWASDNGVILASKNGKWRFMNREGKVILNTSYDNVGIFSKSLVWVQKRGKYGFLDRSGKVVIPLDYDDVTSFNDEGFASVRKGKERFVIDTKGEKV